MSLVSENGKSSRRIPEEYLQGLLDAAPLAVVAGQFTDLKPDGSNRLKACCPMHDEKTPSFKIDTHDDHYHCYGCGESGNAFTLVMQVKNVPFPEAVKWVAQLVDHPMPPRADDQSDPEARERAVIRQSHRQTADQFAGQLWGSDTGAKARQYLMRERGFSREVLERYGVGFAGDRQAFMEGVGKAFGWRILEKGGLLVLRDSTRSPGKKVPIPLFSRRITFPIRLTGGQCVAFGGRILEGDGPKYINSPESPVYTKGHHLFGLHEAIQDTNENTPRDERRLMRITEGYTDVLRASDTGLGRTVASCGTALTEQQGRLAFRYADRLLLYFDGDRAGQEAAYRACATLAPLLGPDRRVSIVIQPSGEDLDTLLARQGSDAVRQREQSALPLSEFVMLYAARQHGSESVESRTKVVSVLRQFCERIEDETLRELFQTEIHRRFIGSDIEPDVARRASQAYLASSPERAAQMLKACSSEVAESSYALCAQPALHHLLPEDTLDRLAHNADCPLSASEKRVLELAVAVAQRAEQQETEVMDIFSNDYKAFVGHLKTEGGLMSEAERIQSCLRLRQQLTPDAGAGAERDFFLSPAPPPDEPTSKSSTHLRM